MTSLMKMFVGCHIQGYLGPTIASLKHHWVMESPQITKALNKDMNNFQKSFYLSQKHEQQREQRAKGKCTCDCAALLLLSFRGHGTFCCKSNKTLPETSLLVNLCLSSWGVLRHVGKCTSLPEERQQAKSKGCQRRFCLTDLSGADVCVFAPSAQRTIWPCLHEVGISVKSDSFKISS